MTNEMIGIAGVFVLTFLLLLLRHFSLTLGRHNTRHNVARTAPSTNREQLGEDDAWLLWTPEPDQADSSKLVDDEFAERRASTERKGSSPLR